MSSVITAKGKFKFLIFRIFFRNLCLYIFFLYTSAILTPIVVMHHNDFSHSFYTNSAMTAAKSIWNRKWYNLEMVNLLAGWKERCAKFFPYSTYFEGSRSSAFNQIGKSTENGSSNHVESTPSNGKLEAFKDLTIWRSWRQAKKNGLVVT